MDDLNYNSAPRKRDRGDEISIVRGNIFREEGNNGVVSDHEDELQDGGVDNGGDGGHTSRDGGDSGGDSGREAIHDN